MDADAECGNFAHTAWNLATVDSLAMENETSCIHEEDRAGAVADPFEVTEAMICVVVNGIEGYEMELKRGIHAPKEASHEAWWPPLTLAPAAMAACAVPANACTLRPDETPVAAAYREWAAFRAGICGPATNGMKKHRVRSAG